MIFAANLALREDPGGSPSDYHIVRHAVVGTRSSETGFCTPMRKQGDHEEGGRAAG